MATTFENYLRSNADASNFRLKTYIQPNGSILFYIYPIDGNNPSGQSYKINGDRLEHITPEEDQHHRNYPVTAYPEFLG